MDLGIDHLVRSVGHSLSGLRIAYGNEQAFRHECFVGFVLTLVLVLKEMPPMDWCLALGGWLAVMAVELLNSAVEKTCDLVTRDFDPLVKAAKDMASAAVFVMIAANVVLWACLFVFR